MHATFCYSAAMHAAFYYSVAIVRSRDSCVRKGLKLSYFDRLCGVPASLPER
jgi:hypothetical protein